MGEVTGGAAAFTARQDALRIATLACYAWFSIAFMVGKGGPLLNFWLYPVIGVFVALVAVPLALSGQLPTGMLGPGWTFADPRLVWAVVSFFVPGLLFGVGVTGAFLIVLTCVFEADDEWAARHMPPEWHELQARVRTQRDQ